MRDSAEYSTIVRNEILTCPVPERVTHVLWCTRLNVRSHVCMLSYTFPRPAPPFPYTELNHQYCRYAPIGKRKRKGSKTKHLEKYTLRIPASRCSAAYTRVRRIPQKSCTHRYVHTCVPASNARSVHVKIFGSLSQ